MFKIHEGNRFPPDLLLTNHWLLVGIRPANGTARVEKANHSESTLPTKDVNAADKLDWFYHDEAANRTVFVIFILGFTESNGVCHSHHVISCL